VRVPAHPSAPVLPRERVSRWDLGLAPVLPTGKAPPMATVSERDSAPDQARVLAPVLPTGKAPPMATVSERDSAPDQARVLAQVRAKALHSGWVQEPLQGRVLVWELLVACSIVPSESRPVLLSCRATGRC